jgi:hypothetical protein
MMKTREIGYTKMRHLPQVSRTKHSAGLSALDEDQ